MGSTKHEKTFVDYDKSYEQNIIGLKGIVYFGIGLLLLIVVTFVLMFFLINVMEDQSRKEKDQMLPMHREAIEKNPDAFLPPEPRLQVAPGFGVEGQNGRVNLELKAPQSEWLELEKNWKAQLLNGQKDQKTGTVISLGIEEAKKRLLEENVKARPAEQGQKSLDEARSIISYSSAGRVANEKRR
jgi:hypothetical protein